MYIVRDEITDLGSIVTDDFALAKKYAKQLVISYKSKIKSKEKIKSSLKSTYYSCNGRKAEVEYANFYCKTNT